MGVFFGDGGGCIVFEKGVVVRLGSKKEIVKSRCLDLMIFFLIYIFYIPVLPSNHSSV